jgi:hypothetical protein
VRKSVRVPLSLLTAAAMAAIHSESHAAPSAKAAPIAEKTLLVAGSSQIERAGFGLNLEGWPFFLVLGAGTIFLLIRSGGE